MNKIILIFSIIAISALSLNAQPIEPPLVPIDGGISYLIAAGLLIGIKKLIGINKKK